MKNSKKKKRKNTYLIIDGNNWFIKFKQNPMNLKGPKIGAKFSGTFGAVTSNLLFGHKIFIFVKTTKIMVDSKYDFYYLSFKTKFNFLGWIVLEI